MLTVERESDGKRGMKAAVMLRVSNPFLTFAVSRYWERACRMKDLKSFPVVGSSNADAPGQSVSHG